MISNKNSARRVLVTHRLKPTFQRTSILDAVLENRTHPTIRALHDRLRKTVPTLSKTTLYATLDLFAREGLVTPLYIDPAEVRYDGVLAPHHHLSCTRCGAILDLEIVCPKGRRGEFHGHRIDEVRGYFKGICKGCRTSNRPSRAHGLRGGARPAQAHK